jgi:hypothetical protein
VASATQRQLIAKLVAAHEAEARARRRVAKMSRHLVELLGRAREIGLSDAALARALLRRRHSNITSSMKLREIERLRKRRRRGTTRPDLSPQGGVQLTPQRVPSIQEVPTMSKLIKRKITEETFAPDAEDEDLELAGDEPEDQNDDLAGEDDDEDEAA